VSMKPEAPPRKGPGKRGSARRRHRRATIAAAPGRGGLSGCGNPLSYTPVPPPLPVRRRHEYTAAASVPGNWLRTRPGTKPTPWNLRLNPAVGPNPKKNLCRNCYYDWPRRRENTGWLDTAAGRIDPGTLRDTQQAFGRTPKTGA